TLSEADLDGKSYLVPWESALNQGRLYWKEHRHQLRPIASEVKPDELSALIYTSGTTGQPKGVKLTHANFRSNTRSALGMVHIGHEDHHISFLTLCHSFERTAGYTAVLAWGAQMTYAESIGAVSRNLPEVRPIVMIPLLRMFERVYNLISK